MVPKLNSWIFPRGYLHTDEMVRLCHSGNNARQGVPTLIPHHFNLFKFFVLFFVRGDLKFPTTHFNWSLSFGLWIRSDFKNLYHSFQGSFTCGPCSAGYGKGRSGACADVPGSCPDGTVCDRNAECYRHGRNYRYLCKVISSCYLNVALPGKLFSQRWLL